MNTMNYRIAIVFTLMCTGACRTMEKLEGHYDTSPRKYSYTTDSVLYKLKRSFAAQGATVIDDDSAAMTAVLHHTSWTWEKRNKTPHNGNAYVVIKKYYDIGSNRNYKPLDVVSTWMVSVTNDKHEYVIKLADVEVQYKSVHYVVEHKAGVSLGNLERKIEKSMH